MPVVESCKLAIVTMGKGSAFFRAFELDTGRRIAIGSGISMTVGSLGSGISMTVGSLVVRAFDIKSAMMQVSSR